jgi:hypothetical protein
LARWRDISLVRRESEWLRCVTLTSPRLSRSRGSVGAALGGSPSKDHDRNKMIASVLVSTRRRDCLHQTPIEAQPPRSGGAGPQARGPRNDSVPSCRPIQRVDSWIRRSRSVVRGGKSLAGAGSTAVTPPLLVPLHGGIHPNSGPEFSEILLEPRGDHHHRAVRAGMLREALPVAKAARSHPGTVVWRSRVNPLTTCQTQERPV